MRFRTRIDQRSNGAMRCSLSLLVVAETVKFLGSWPFVAFPFPSSEAGVLVSFPSFGDDMNVFVGMLQYATRTYTW